MNGAKPKVTGSGTITHRCAQCQRLIWGDPIFMYRDGRLVAVHADCHQKEN